VAGKSLKDIAAAMFELSISAVNLGATNAEILRALAIILHEAEQATDMVKVIDRIEALINGPIALLDEKVDVLADIASTHKTSMDNVVTEVRTQLNNSSEGIEKMVENATLRSAQQTSTSAGKERSEGPLSYAAAAKAGVPLALTKLLARSEAQSRQILIDRRSVLIANSLRELTEAQLVSKASTALELMEQNGIETPKELTFVSARRLPHGGVLYELNSKDSAEWFNSPTNRSNFLEYFAPNASIKDRSYHVLMENVPITFIPDNPAAIADIEKKAGLNPKSISKAKFIKPAARRHPNQRTAHVVITFASKEHANQAIKFGLAIAGKKVYGRKLLPEPSRCLKCHAFDGGHMAADCPQEQDTCGSCGEAHRTSECPIDNPEDYACANCKTKGHAAWSRQCPIFVQKWDNFKRRNDEAKYIYYPTEDPLTWESVANHIEERTDSHPPPPTDQFSQQNQRYPPPARNRQEWNTVNRSRQPPANRNPANANNIPLGPKAQHRLPESWFNSETTHQHHPSTPPHWSPSPPPAPYNSDSLAGPSGWD
jgi:hypothetical protein